MTRAVLTFHSVDDSGSVLSFPVRAFADFIEHLLAAGIPVVPFAELARVPLGVTLTFDDGMASVARNALPVLRAAALPSHLFLTTGRVGLDNRWASQPPGIAPMELMDWTSVEACAAAAMTIECHTTTHPDLRRLSRSAIDDECATAEAAIEQRIGRRPTLFAYPYGHENDAVREVVSQRYAAAFSTRLGYLDGSPDRYRIPRIDTYYLREPRIAQRLLQPAGRAYVAVRALLRALRGSA